MANLSLNPDAPWWACGSSFVTPVGFFRWSSLMRLLAAVIVGFAILFVPRVAWPADAAQNVGLSKSEAVSVATRYGLD
jgi:hypothetical protein